MNKELRVVRDHIEANPEQFRMRTWMMPHGSCGTVGCIAGHAVMMFRPDLVSELTANDTDWVRHGADICGLPLPVACHLFVPARWILDLHRRRFQKRYESVWTGNYRCDLDTVERMQQWAQEFNAEYFMHHIDAGHAVRCIDQLEVNPHYVDWQRAVAPESV